MRNLTPVTAEPRASSQEAAGEAPPQVRNVLAERTLALATLFHDLYEALAPAFGYTTRLDTRRFDPESTNGKLMVAVCGEIIKRGEIAAAPRLEPRLEKVERLIGVYFAPWGAAKAAEWEELSGDREFSAGVALDLIRAALVEPAHQAR